MLMHEKSIATLKKNIDLISKKNVLFCFFSIVELQCLQISFNNSPCKLIEGFCMHGIILKLFYFC